jgi:hypothetical protein
MSRIALESNLSGSGVFTIKSPNSSVDRILTLPDGDGELLTKEANPNYRSFRNKIINGNFDIWQRATSQTSSGYGSDDRWVNGNTGTTKTHSQQLFTLGQTAVPGDPNVFSRTVVNSVAGANNYCIKQQRFEFVRLLSGKTITLSFYAKADSTKNIAIEFAQFFGTGGSPSTQVSGIGSQLVQLTTSWQKFEITVQIPSISGKVLGTSNNDYLELTFWFDAGSTFASRTASLGQQSGTFDLAQVQLEEGSIATLFEQRSFGAELSMCQRYYLSNRQAFGGMYASTGLSYNVFFPCTMRTAPVITKSSTLGTFNSETITVNSWSGYYTGTVSGIAAVSADAEL